MSVAYIYSCKSHWEEERLTNDNDVQEEQKNFTACWADENNEQNIFPWANRKSTPRAKQFSTKIRKACFIVHLSILMKIIKYINYLGNILMQRLQTVTAVTLTVALITPMAFRFFIHHFLNRNKKLGSVWQRLMEIYIFNVTIYRRQ